MIALSGSIDPSHEKEMMQKFVEWTRTYNKEYIDEEISTRYINFKASVERINKKNAESPNKIWGLTKFSDMTPHEFKEKALLKPKTPKRVEGVDVLQPKPITAPTFLDWRTKGAVTPVKNQEQCGSCWAFSVTENVESQWILAGHGTNATIDLAPQQIVDCDSSDDGCNGGDPPTAYEYLMTAGGLESESAYPYTAEDGSCSFKKGSVVAKISNWKYATSSDDETTMQNNLVSWGPLSVCVDAANWQDYSGGVMGGWQCAWINILDHCVELVGYDTTGSTPFWIVRNSWGTDWGENGYIRLEMWDNTCGISEEATSAVI
jgi:C1A family cysteine protease